VQLVCGHGIKAQLSPMPFLKSKDFLSLWKISPLHKVRNLDILRLLMPSLCQLPLLALRKHQGGKAIFTFQEGRWNHAWKFDSNYWKKYLGERNYEQR